jgi:hypothetical protein
MSLDYKVFEEENIILPLLPEEGRDLTDEVTIHNRFCRHLRMVPTRRGSIKVLSAIQFTADFLGYSDAHVTKVLIELGLRAPRSALPQEFLDYADMALPRGGWVVGGPSKAVQELASHWRSIGEDPFVAIRRQFPLVDEKAFL